MLAEPAFEGPGQSACFGYQTSLPQFLGNRARIEYCISRHGVPSSWLLRLQIGAAMLLSWLPATEKTTQDHHLLGT